MKLDAEHARAFFRALMPPGYALEMRIKGAQFDRGYISPGDRYSAVFSGWYDNPNSLLCDANRLRGVSGYIIPNPTITDMLACSYNKLSKTGSATKDEHISCLRWLYLDFDAKKPSDNMSATDSELAEAIAKRDAALAAHPEMRDSAIWGCSGNGGWCLIRLPDYPNDEEHRAIVAAAVDYFFENHGADRKTKNPARLMPLVGTFKCKGSNRPERPWRLATLDSPHDKTPIPFDLISWVAASCAGPAESPLTPSDEAAAMLGVEVETERLKRAVAYVASLAPAVSGHGGHDQTLDAACALTEGFGLSATEARPILEAWNQRCQPPWSTAELDHKLTDAERKADGSPRKGHLLEKGQAPGTGGRNIYTFGLPPNQPPAIGPNGVPMPDPDGEGPACTPGFEDNPHRLARLYLRRNHSHSEGVTLRYWRQKYHTWYDGHYHKSEPDEIKGRVSSTLDGEFMRIYQAEIIREGMKEDGKPVKPLPVTTAIVNNVMLALSGLILLPTSKYPEQPAWVDDAMMWPVSEVLPMRNLIVHLPSFVNGMECTRKPTPMLFCHHALNYDWTPDVPAPEKWLRFLGSVWPDDPQSIATLQEWFGLNLVADTSYEKIIAIIGPPRCGKGTIASVLSALIGPENCVGPTLSSLEYQFGIESLVGKLSAIIDDARIGPKADQAVIAERLLTISGQGWFTVERKNIAAWTGRLSTRLTILSNEMLRIVDSSGALNNRFIILKMTKSFLGREDKELKQSLLTELPGILLWAIEGWKRLGDRGYFVQPETGADIHDDMTDLASPITAFVRERCHVGSEHRAKCSAVYAAWREWCEANGMREPSTQAIFGRSLRSICPDLKTPQIRESGAKPRYYSGVGLVTPAEMAAREMEPASPEEEEEWFRQHES